MSHNYYTIHNIREKKKQGINGPFFNDYHETLSKTQNTHPFAVAPQIIM